MMKKGAIVVKVRNQHQAFGGVQRHTLELTRRLGGGIDLIDPGPLGGVPGHLLEQFVLPGKERSRQLWSPGNIGPLAIRRQVITSHDMTTFDSPRGLVEPLRPLVSVVTAVPRPAGAENHHGFRLCEEPHRGSSRGRRRQGGGDP